MHWRSLLRNASVGIISMAAVEALESDGRERSASSVAVNMAVGGALAVAYARLVPAEHWGIESGAAFAQLPLVLSLSRLRRGSGLAHARFERSRMRQAAELSLWGMATGFLMHQFGEAPRTPAKLLDFRTRA